ncbi:MAG: hypothetical protein IT342_26005 [Candidatus Melainabacteria bacterium]|nr:hypothetical protein [Candidatus Melainabacteria bacterium]
MVISKKISALSVMTLIVVAQSFPLAAPAQGPAGGLPPAILGEVEGNKPGAATITPAEPDPRVEPVTEPAKEPAVKPESTSAHMGSPERPHAGLIEETAKEAFPVKQAPKKPIMLYGRLEEISGKAAPTFPIVLKALTPKMDQTGLLKGQATEGTLAGRLEKSYPADFRGTWGGSLTLGQLVITPLNYQIDPDDARKTASLVRQGSVGTANFVFDRDGRGNITVEPTQIIFMVPANQTNSFQLAMQQAGGANAMGGNAMAGMMKSMMSNMQVPIAIKFGNFQSSAMNPSISGNSFSIGVLSNRLKQLSPGIMEQQVITQENIRIARTGKTYSTYNENIFRFTQRGASQMYVEVASVSYDMARRFLRKMVLYGYVTKGAVQQDFSNPYAGLQQMMGGTGGAGGMQIPGMGGGSGNPLQQLQDLQKMFGGQ